jgi:hypothetical protein
VADRPENAKVVQELTAALLRHLETTAREREKIAVKDMRDLIDHLLQPRDVETTKKNVK